MAYTRSTFIKKIAPMAQRDAVASKVLASLTIAQAILESNNGNSRLSVEGKALFGIKANKYWRGKVWTGNTIEYYAGKKTEIVAGFRAYDSWEESIRDHSALISRSPRYKAVVSTQDYKKACVAIHQAGYATDPNYASKLIALIETYKLYQYDTSWTNTVDKPLFNAVSKIIKSGIALEFNAWKRMDLMQLKYVPALLGKLGGLDKLVQEGIIGQPSLWKRKQYTTHHVRSLLIKYAAHLS